MRVLAWFLWAASGVCLVAAAVLIMWVLVRDGLTQPEATITTGVLAICAAGVAFLGVHRTIRSNERVNERNRAADAARAQRAELLEVVRDTIAGMFQLTSSLIDLNNSRRAFVLGGPSTEWDEGTYKAAEARLTASWALLAALGQPALATELADLLGHADDCVKLGDEPTASRDERLALIEQWNAPYTEASARMLTALQQLLGDESKVVLPPASWNPPRSKYHRSPDDAEQTAEAVAPDDPAVDE